MQHRQLRETGAHPPAQVHQVESLPTRQPFVGSAEHQQGHHPLAQGLFQDQVEILFIVGGKTENVEGFANGHDAVPDETVATAKNHTATALGEIASRRGRESGQEIDHSPSLGGTGGRPEVVQQLAMSRAGVDHLDTGENFGNLPFQLIEIPQTKIVGGQLDSAGRGRRRRLRSEGGVERPILFPGGFIPLSVTVFLIENTQGIHQHALGIEVDFLMQHFRKIAVFVGNHRAVDIQGESSLGPAQHLNHRHLDQGAQPPVGVLLFQRPFLDEGGDQRLARRAGVLLAI